MSLFLCYSYFVVFLLCSVRAADPRCSSTLEVWSECDAFCQKTCANPGGTQPCPESCTPGCVCGEGLVRNGSRDCIAASQCTAISMNCPGPNEVISQCQANGCQNTCAEPGRIAYCDPYGCSFGCICEEGYLRDAKDVCTWAEDCVKCEDKYARWSNVNATSCQNSCAQPDLSSYGCKPGETGAGCVCLEGYLLGKDGTCLPAESCAFCDDPNAVYSLTLATGCQNTCENPTFETVCRPLGPKAGCICKKGFVKNSKGLCVTLKQCKTSVCGINEHLDPCAKTCPPETCASNEMRFKCAAQPPKDCKAECRCNVNHKRDARGICVPIEKCPAFDCPGQYEVYVACPSFCPGENCQDSLSQPQCPLTIDNICQPSCRCLDGFYRNENNSYTCVPKEECFKSCSDENEEYIENGPSCQRSCSSMYLEDLCIEQVQSGCFCKKGYIRNSRKKCIQVEDCYLDLCGTNEFRSCGSACDTTCATLNVTCPIINVQCNDMCYCLEGFARDDCGKCISITKCPVNGGCRGDINAKMVSQPNPCPAKCDNSQQQPCTALAIREGCQCNKGYIQDETTNNQCVKPENCHKCNGPNEVWSRNRDCTCADITGESQISLVSASREGCRCIDGYVRDINGICIQAGTCPRCGPLEEYKECGSACPVTCENRFQDLFCIALCVKGCFCKQGLIRDLNGKCVLLDQCPTGCGNDINASKRTFSPSCERTCDNRLAEKLICDETNTIEGCSCNKGYVKDTTTNLCVKPDECRAGCGGDGNAEFNACGNTCPTTCDNLGQNRPCSLLCRTEGGCVCKPGYVQGGPFNRCILPEQCPRCGSNAFYSCGSACQTACSTLNETCPIINIRCNDGCYCSEGYARDAYGRCIPDKICPPKVGCNGDINAYSVKCPSALCSVTCENYKDTTEPQSCDEYCPRDGSKCLCNKGLILDQNTGYCVKSENCNKCTGQNEVYSNGFDVTCAERDSPNFRNILRTRKPTLGCHCKIDFIRNANNECIPAHLCPQKCGSLEEYMECGSACPATCRNLNEPNRICTDQCLVGCYCKSPLVRNDRGQCVYPDQCLSLFGCGGDINASKKNYLVGCVPTCDNPKALENCAAVPTPRSTGCVCNEGFVYDGISKKCIPPSLCFPGCGGDSNAQFHACGNNCPVTCDNFADPPRCIEVCKVNAGECGCKPNFVRNSRGMCVRPSQCDTVIGPPIRPL